MELIGDRYLTSDIPLQQHIQYLLGNIYNNKGIQLEGYKDFEMNRNAVIEKLLVIHDDIRNEEKMYAKSVYECGIDSVEITQHSLPVFPETDVDMYGENNISENCRARENINADDLVAGLFDNKYGLINNIYKDIHSVEYAVVGAQISPVGKKQVGEIGFGRSENFKKAKLEAVLEALERYSMFSINNEMRKLKVSQALHNEYQTEEFKAFLEKNVTAIEGVSLRDNNKIWMPLQLFNYANRDGFKLVAETSNGMALGSTYNEAMVYSLLEFIERDAFLNFWHKMIPLKRIKTSSLDEECLNVIKSFETDKKHVYLFDLSLDIRIPVIMALVISFDIKPCTYVSSAAHLNYNKAAASALKEAVVAHNIYRNNPAVGKKYESKEEVIDLSDHYNYYARPEKIKTYDFLFKDITEHDINLLFDKVNLKTDKEALDYLLSQMSHIKDIYGFELKNKVINDAGFVVTKVIIPEMQTMYFGVQNQRINKKRMEAAFRNSPYNQSALSEERYNDEPHPFP